MKIIEVWAQLYLSEKSCEQINKLFLFDIGVNPKYIIKKPHLTVYHARRPMENLFAVDEQIEIQIPSEDTRFMVLAPGGENPKPTIIPKNHKVGIRIKKSDARKKVLVFRHRLLEFETNKVLGNRKKSTDTRNAFGARSFQPHMALIRPGSGINNDLTLIGNIFRDKISLITFDRFEIEIVKKVSDNK